MKLKEQIIRELFKSETPDCRKHILAVFCMFRALIDWKDFRNLLIEYHFEALPKYLGMFQRTTKAKDKSHT